MQLASAHSTTTRPAELPLGMSIDREVVTNRTVSADGRTTSFKTERRPLTYGQLARDSVATAAAANATRIATWAEQRGLGAVTDALRGAKITLTDTMHDGAWSDLTFGSPQALTRRHYARSPETWGHEVAHRVMDAYAALDKDERPDESVTTKLLETEEGIADIFGVAYARSVGHRPALADFVLNDELEYLTTDPAIRRDLAAYPDLTVEKMLSASVSGPNGRYSWGRPLGATYVGLVRQLGDERAGSLVFDVVTRELAKQLAGAPKPLPAEPVDRVRAQYGWLREAFIAAAGKDVQARAAVESGFARILAP